MTHHILEFTINRVREESKALFIRGEATCTEESETIMNFLEIKKYNASF